MLAAVPGWWNSASGHRRAYDGKFESHREVFDRAGNGRPGRPIQPAAVASVPGMGAANMPLRRTIVRRYARKRILRQRLPETSWKMSQGVFCGGFRRPLCIGRFTARLAAMPRRGNAYPLVLRAACQASWFPSALKDGANGEACLTMAQEFLKSDSHGQMRLLLK